MNDLEIQDKAARTKALDANQSFIVQAPAGSGKTELLIQRFLTLLTIVKTPEEILAMTFTKKAANEMRLRVLNALKAAQHAEPESEHAKLTWRIARSVLERDRQHQWNIIENPNRLRIQTIDSLCAYLTKQLPLLSHFGSQPEIAPLPQTLYRDAVREVLSHVEENFEWSHAISQLLLHLDNDFNKLHDLLVSLLAKRDQWLPYIALDMNNSEIRQVLETQLEGVICDSLKKLAHLFPQELVEELLSLLRYAADNLLGARRTSPIGLCDELNVLPQFEISDKPSWLGIATLLLTKEGEWRKQVDNRLGFPAPTSTKNPEEKAFFSSYKKRMTTLLNQLNENDSLKLALREVISLPEATYSEDQWEILQALLIVLKVMAAQLRVTFQQQGQIDFIENAQAALLALGNDEHPTDLALALDYQIRHLLVDEFQDTSYTQYHLIEKLTMGWEKNDGRTLFVVGDPMQSIYRFRQAEVGLFIRLRENGLRHINLVPLTLSVNFRSLAPIVEWNNKHFDLIFPNFNDIASGAVSYSHSIAKQAAADSDSISLHGFLNETSNAQAKAIVEIVKSERERHPHDKIAILVRSRSNLAEIIPALNQASIPYQAIEIDSLISKQHIQDLLALTCALLHLGDRIAWLAILRAPWCGLCLSDLLIIGKEANSIIWQRINNPVIFNELSTDAKTRLQRIIPILHTSLAQRERYDYRRWIENCWLLLGGPATLKTEVALNDCKAYFDLITEFTSANRLFSIDKFKEALENLFACAANEANAVQIMTIHASKGLEFDTVILPHLERKMVSNDKTILQWMERPLANNQNALLLAPIHATGNDIDPVYAFITEKEKDKTKYEIDRLLYVATTRAKSRLHLLYQLKATDGEVKADASSFLARLLPFIEVTLSKEGQANEAASVEKKPRPITRLDSQWQHPLPATSQVNLVFHNNNDGFALKDQTPRLLGTVIHLVLQQLSLQGINWWQDQPEATQRAYLYTQLKQHGIAAHRLPQAVNDAYTAIQNTLNDERGRWILTAHVAHQSEFAITACVGGKLENHIIDRTFISADGERWIIDYKTTTFSHQELSEFKRNEEKKYAEKMKAYQTAMSIFEARPIRLGLYFPYLRIWHEVSKGSSLDN